MTALNDQVLVLNKGYQPVDVICVKDAISSTYKESAQIIDSDYSRYTWEDWYELFSVPLNDNFDEDFKYVTDKSLKVRVPEVIILNDYKTPAQRDVKLTRRHLYIRDRGRCQYTGKKLSTREATLDHIMPRSRGGKNTWENLVLCDPRVNRQKDNKTPQEAGLKLLRKPFKPKWHPMYNAYLKSRPESWYNFVKKEDWEVCYWDVELEEN